MSLYRLTLLIRIQFYVDYIR